MEPPFEEPRPLPGHESPEDAQDDAAPLRRLADRLAPLLRADPELRAVAREAADWVRVVCDDADEEERVAARADAARSVEEPRRRVILSLGGQEVSVAARGEEPVAKGEQRSRVLQGVDTAAPVHVRKSAVEAPAVLPSDPSSDLEHCERLAERAALDLERLAAEQRPEARSAVAAELASGWDREGVDLRALRPAVRLLDADDLREIAELYANLARAARVARAAREETTDDSEMLAGAYTLLAESQSALRVALEDRLGVRRDGVQDMAFRWLDRRTKNDRVYVARHMRLDDAGDPRAWRETRARIDAFDVSRRSVGAQREAKRSVLEDLELHLRRLADVPDGAPVTDAWRRIDNGLAKLLDAGVPASNRELREALLPLLDRLPEGYVPGEGLKQVLVAIDRFQLERERREAAATPERPRERNADVCQVADLLRGRELVLIGGEERPGSKAALVRDLELADVHWISTNAHQSYTWFEPAVARPETAIVLLAIRWSSHSFENVKALCERYDKPYVRLPGGYNPNQVARQILDQASAKLGG